ncbi:uncharacterized protein NECHADRAFT_89511 [Fusarium vanettenii 77-13-4]|uniref:Heterokaryon incompatibility domain-containing protein n=1 Tax=Fusarium vanettenii (strain ATCC MYA-4622 / CBS 123669 / FGSC 9596 / NRRL 45880 / 77-13-4) TaxID=660122 RepID=C7ZRF2_FUSV7|nr:uncharacterized protein NECHADRAFT_89511 [Fusarium vanettenii 77-13-4]EEU33406.1 hypothetical protein NECHADRAFT_89511 [Fusarium vanettenii 77-13-4]
MATVITPTMRSEAMFAKPLVFALYLLERPKETEERSIGQLLDARWIDRDLAGSWKSKCTNLHRGLCTELPNKVLASIRSAWLVDVDRQCIVPATEDHSYIALSYVWGSQSTFNTTESGLDNTAQKAVEISKMAMIYANASVTLLAAGGEHANSGLSGFRGISEPRHLHQTVHSEDEKTKLVATPVSDSAVSLFEPTDGHSIWGSRGWIFQEYLFSRRRSVFTGNSLRWECKSAVWREHVKLPPIFDSTQSRVIPCSFIMERSVPNLSLFRSFLTDYNQRQFTHPEDCLDGFAGISLLLSTKLSGGFASGLPTAFFDLVLSWEPGSQLSRRVARNSSRANELPSWSWAGWSSDIRFGHESCDFIRTGRYEWEHRNTRGTIRTRFWKLHGAPNSVGTSIRASIFDCKDELKSGYFDHDKGWSRHKIPEGSQPDSYYPSSTLRTHFYTHQTYPSYEFRYPIPLMQPEEVVPAVFSPYISTTSQRAWFACDGEPWMTGKQHLLFILRKRDGTWAGVMQPHDGLDMSGLALQNPNEAVELVEIAAGFCSESEWSGVYEVYHQEHPRASHWYEYFNVLRVKWADGIAYRRGIGRIHKVCWEAQRGESFELILG